MPDLEKAAKSFSVTGVYALLLDPRTPDNAVSRGTANLSAYRKLQRAVNCPVILAGGINPKNVKEAVFQTEAPIIDLMTGVERSPGIKDVAKVMAFFQALQECED
jgi:phosphoribosylanthranilate isomerase